MSLHNSAYNPFVPNAPFLYPLKTLETFMVFCFSDAFREIEKGCIRNQWFNSLTSDIHYVQPFSVNQALKG